MHLTRFAFVVAWLLGTTSLWSVPVRIACIGDSITEGAGLSNPTRESYPAKLGSLLGTNYTVRNFGVSGRTLLKKGDYPYWKEAYFKASHDWQPDIVIIQLGTNDSKPINWRYSTNFVAEYEELIDSYANLTNHPRVIVCTPCPVYNRGAFTISPGVIATNIAPALRDLATRRNLDLIDLHTRLAGHSEWFPDTVHPNSKGMTAMAAVMYAGLSDPPLEPPVETVDVRRPAKTSTVLSWSAESRDLIPQFTTALRGTNTTWSVAEAVIYLYGDVVRQTNTMSGAARFYRLWQP